jgi:hypothetical protein
MKMDAHLMEHVNESALAHLPAHHGAFLQYTTEKLLSTALEDSPQANFF